MSKRQRLLDRLEKLLALSHSPNVYEAAAARRMANEHMARNGLTEADVHQSSGYYELPLGAKGWNVAWRFALVTIAARHCGVEAIALQVGRKRKVRLVGDRAGAERAHQLYESLLAIVAELEREAAREYHDVIGMIASRSKCSPRLSMDSFRRGVTAGIARLMFTWRRAQESGESSTRESSTRESSTRESSTRESSTRESGVADSSFGDKQMFSGLELARTETRGSKAQTDYSDKMRAKYTPTEKPFRLNDVADLLMYDLGTKIALERVVVDDVGVRVGPSESATRESATRESATRAAGSRGSATRAAGSRESIFEAADCPSMFDDLFFL